MKRVLSIILSLTMLLTLTTPALAAETGQDTITFNASISDTIRLETKFSPRISTDDADIASPNIYDFEFREFENNNLIQTVEGCTGGDILTVTDYVDGIAVFTEVIQVSDRVKVIVHPSTFANSLGSVIGYITYNYSYVFDREQRVQVYSKLTNTDYESYTINGKATDTLAIIAGIIASALSVVITPAGSEIFMSLAISIVAGVGGSIAGGEIGKAFSEDVAVYAYHYTLTGYDATNERYSNGTDGVAMRVLTTESDYYDEWLYEGYTPDNWKEEDILASIFWGEMYRVIFPGVKSYS